ncbi:hypothetical protein [Candidatus Nitrosocosmicus hydrocola]|uniref:hypothetical protein n=1 Tax=Candidatus Nitrosocosmicus hydrocola TaxID=1826872 RepID=UPI0013732631|nr:hypothetical protein [Candidatus Nitrosocosmicus hydrocola]
MASLFEDDSLKKHLFVMTLVEWGLRKIFAFAEAGITEIASTSTNSSPNKQD